MLLQLVRGIVGGLSAVHNKQGCYGKLTPSSVMIQNIGSESAAKICAPHFQSQAEFTNTQTFAQGEFALALLAREHLVSTNKTGHALSTVTAHNPLDCTLYQTVVA